MNSHFKFEMDRLEKIVQELSKDLISLRRSLHQEPEIGWKETKTSGKIRRFLENLDQVSLTYPLETGVVAEIISLPDAPYLGFRADIDALPVHDEKEVAYRSKFPNVYHACGHDVHTTVGCGIIAALSRLKPDIPFNVRIMFQPAEEPIPSGAPGLIKSGVLHNVNTIWAMHVDPNLPLGTISLTDGWVNSQSVKLDWKIRGVSGHSARPELAKNPIPVSSRLIQEVQAIADRIETSDNEIKVLAFTGIKSSGESYNTSPEYAEITATLRTSSENLREKLINQITKFSSQLAAENDLNILFSAIPGSPPVMNDSLVIEKIKAILKQYPHQKYQIIGDLRSKGGDDFGWYTKDVPGAMVRFGTSSGKDSPQLHTSLFDVPEEIIPQAVLFYTLLILEWN